MLEITISFKLKPKDYKPYENALAVFETMLDIIGVTDLEVSEQDVNE